MVEPISETLAAPTRDRLTTVAIPWGLWLLLLAALFALNWFSQPYEDSISLVPPTRAFYLDPIWYLDDIAGPSLFILAAVMLARQAGLAWARWPLLGLALCCLGFGLGDTTDIHWVLPTGIHAVNDNVSFSSWMSKVMVVIVFCFFVIHAYDHLARPAQKAILFALFLLYLDQIQMSISLDFAGYAFHVFEESLEVATGLFVLVGVSRYRFNPLTA